MSDSLQYRKMMTLVVIVLAVSNFEFTACQQQHQHQRHEKPEHSYIQHLYQSNPAYRGINVRAQPAKQPNGIKEDVSSDDNGSMYVGDQIKRIQRYVEALVKELEGLEAKHVALQRRQANTTRSLDQIVTTVEKLNKQLTSIKSGAGGENSEVKRLRRDLKSLRNKTHERIQHLKTKLWALVNELTSFVNESNYNTTKIFKLTFRKINENKKAISSMKNYTRAFVKEIVKKKLSKFKEKLDKFIAKKVQEHVRNQTAMISKRILNRAADGCWESSCYYFREIWSTWPEAKSYCQKISGDLASFETADEEYQVMQLTPEWAKVNQSYTHSFWLDGSSPDSERWHWAKTGRKFDHTNWLSGYPNIQRPRTPANELELCLKTCFSMNGENGWCNANCFERNAYICEV